MYSKFVAKNRMYTTPIDATRHLGHLKELLNTLSGPPKKKSSPLCYAQEELHKSILAPVLQRYFNLKITPQSVDSFIAKITNKISVPEELA